MQRAGDPGWAGARAAGGAGCCHGVCAAEGLCAAGVGGTFSGILGGPEKDSGTAGEMRCNQTFWRLPQGSIALCLVCGASFIPLASFIQVQAGCQCCVIEVVWRGQMPTTHNVRCADH